MTRPIQSRWLLLPIVAALTFLGCQDSNPQSVSSTGVTPDKTTSGETENEDRSRTPKPDKRKAIAEKAKDALFARLSGRLMKVMQSNGPAAAINVCSNEAVKIAEAVGEEYGVQIGRTSFKLRNPDNASRDWVKPYVEQRVDKPQYAQLNDGSLGAVYPIHMTVKCLMCHGGKDDVLDAVKPELAKHYPDDAATEFKLNDLRGWFWVEVPSTVKETVLPRLPSRPGMSVLEGQTPAADIDSKNP